MSDIEYEEIIEERKRTEAVPPVKKTKDTRDISGLVEALSLIGKRIGNVGTALPHELEDK